MYPGAGSSHAPLSSGQLGAYLYFQASDGTAGIALWRVDGDGVTASATPPGTNVYFGCMCVHPIITLGGRLFAIVYSDETGEEFTQFNEPTLLLPETNASGTSWSTALIRDSHGSYTLAFISAALLAGLARFTVLMIRRPTPAAVA